MTFRDQLVETSKRNRIVVVNDAYIKAKNACLDAATEGKREVKIHMDGDLIDEVGQRLRDDDKLTLDDANRSEGYLIISW